MFLLPRGSILVSRPTIMLGEGMVAVRPVDVQVQEASFGVE